MIADKKYSNYLFGRWWDRTSEVDLVGIDKENKKVIIGEVKFKVLDKSEIKEIQKDLIEKAKKVNTFNFEQKLIIICLNTEYEDEEIEIIKLEK
jgi:AAA+ ATPase superfamily predicted ATPase